MKTKLWTGIALLAVLAVVAVVLLSGVIRTYPQVVEEQQRTPSPSPVYGNVMAVTPDPSQPTPLPVMKNGSRGVAVQALQMKLRELGYFSDEADGYYGPVTEQAVLIFQQQNGLDADGVAGPMTNELLFSGEAAAFTATPEPSPIPAAVTEMPESTDMDQMEEVVLEEVVLEEEVQAQKGYVTPDGFPLLVNREFPLADDYVPYDLVDMNDYCDSGIVGIKYKETQGEREAVDALMVMLGDAVAEGISPWQISAAYRTVKDQQRIFNNRVNEYMKENGLSRSKARSATRKTVADPGTSEHHLGTCFDITVPGTTFAGTEQARWLEEHCWDYGFIQRYTKDKEKITGFLAEAWHFRYVGEEHARIMRDENLCLEEYLEKYKPVI